MIAVIATAHAHSGKEAELEQVLKGLIARTRREAGCIQYDLHVGVNDPAAFAFYERWVDQAALETHLRTPHVSAALPRIAELSEAPPSIVVYRLEE
jgi:quinol monooxygenase YgiN